MIKKITAFILVLSLFAFVLGCEKETQSKNYSSEPSKTVQSQKTNSDTSKDLSSEEKASSEISDGHPASSVNSASSKNQTSVSKVTQSSTVSSKTSSLQSNVSSKDTRPSALLTDFVPVSRNDYYSYNKLTTVQKTVYNEIYDMVKNYKTGHKFIEGANEDDVLKAFNAVHIDNPQFFWMGAKYGLATKTQGSKVTYGINIYDDTYITKDINEKNQKQKQLEDMISSIISSVVKKGMTNAERAKALHDYICEKTAYNYNYTTDKNAFDWTAFGCLINKSSVCEGYSRAYQILLYNVGINATLISGNAKGGAHMWVAAELDGWKTVDITWDDYKSGGYGHTYYNKASLNPSADHKAYALADNATKSDLQNGTYRFFDELK